MPRGFFAGSTLEQVRAPDALVPRCGDCGLYRNPDCKSPKMAVAGKGRKGILVVAEHPSAIDDEKGLHFADKPGKLLRKELDRVGIDLDLDCWKTNAIICHTSSKVTLNQIEDCRPNLKNAIKELQPQTILVIGERAAQGVLGILWREEGGCGPIARWAGWHIPTHNWNAWVCPTYHPQQVIEKEDRKDPILKAVWRQHLAEAAKLQSRPWAGEPPDYRRKVECIVEPAAAAAILDEMVRRGGPVAFDYETNMLKPDGPGARIVCCSVCWRGKRTIAFPWHGPAIQAMSRLIKSPLPKIASNLKFEDRWTRAILGHRVRNWLFDTMLGAHALDNRYGITSIKFQAFIRYGVQDYSSHLKEYLTSKGNETTNRILSEIKLSDLLLYCGLDSLLEYMVAMDMMKDLRMELAA